MNCLNVSVGRYQDAMAIVRVHRRPTYFVTFTCNPGWPEIRDAMLGDQEPQSRPYLARVFSIKLKELLHDISTKGIFGRTVAFLMVVEFQKRGIFDLRFTRNSGVTEFSTISLKETVHLPNMLFHLRYQFCSFGCKKPQSEGFTVLRALSPEIFNFKDFTYWLMEFLLHHLEADSWVYRISSHLW